MASTSMAAVTPNTSHAPARKRRGCAANAAARFFDADLPLNSMVLRTLLGIFGMRRSWSSRKAQVRRDLVSFTLKQRDAVHPRACFCLTEASTPARPVSTMHTAKTQIIRQPQRNRCLLSPISHDRHYRSATRIYSIVLGSIPITRNEIGVPVGLRSWRRDDDNPPGLRLGCGNECPRATQQQSRYESERDGQYLHPRSPCRPLPPASIGLWYHLAMTAEPPPDGENRNSDTHVAGVRKFVIGR